MVDIVVLQVSQPLSQTSVFELFQALLYNLERFFSFQIIKSWPSQQQETYRDRQEAL